MNNRHPFSLLAKLRAAQPIPSLLTGYLCGLLWSFLHILWTKFSPSWELSPLSVGDAFFALCATEFPFTVFCALSGFTKFPRLPLCPVLLRSFLWGYGSFTVCLAAGKSNLYVLYVLGCALTLLPLACLSKWAMRYAASPRRPSWSDHLRYLYQCLYFWGLTLILLFIRGAANHFFC